jgi:hypothetical protein
VILILRQMGPDALRQGEAVIEPREVREARYERSDVVADLEDLQVVP